MYYFLLFFITLPLSFYANTSTSSNKFSLKNWMHSIMQLKEAPTEYRSLPSPKKYTDSILTKERLLKSLVDCSLLVSKQFKQHAWLHGKMLPLFSKITNLEREVLPSKQWRKNFIFTPYAQRLLVENGTKLIFFGDLHGSIHSLLRSLKKLKDDGTLNDEAKIIGKKTYIVFLGDYVDRGIYGAEVIYTLAQLKLANPTQVIFVRGNHEDYKTALSFKKFHNSSMQKDNLPNFLSELECKFKLAYENKIQIYRFYDLLPVVLYIGCNYKNHADYIQCCHGGLELGYNPYDLLHAGKNITFEYIQKLYRKDNFYQKLNRRFQAVIKKKMSSSGLCSDIVNIIPSAPTYIRKKTKQPFSIGFLWNEFFINPKVSIGYKGKGLATWVYGKDLSHSLLRWANSRACTLHGIIRAHQHNNMIGGPMLDLLCCKKGVVNVWDDNSLFTLVSAPQAKLDDTGERCFTYDSFMTIVIHKEFKHWNISHTFRDSSVLQDKWVTKSIR